MTSADNQNRTLTCNIHHDITFTSAAPRFSLEHEGVPVPGADPDIKTREGAANHLCVGLHGAPLAEHIARSS
jgi:hypothetical protein